MPRRPSPFQVDRIRVRVHSGPREDGRWRWRADRPDGRVVGEVHARADVSVGLVAGSPTPEQLRAAAQRALDRADALEARAARRDR